MTRAEPCRLWEHLGPKHSFRLQQPLLPNEYIITHALGETTLPHGNFAFNYATQPSHTSILLILFNRATAFYKVDPLARKRITTALAPKPSSLRSLRPSLHTQRDALVSPDEGKFDYHINSQEDDTIVSTPSQESHTAFPRPHLLTLNQTSSQKQTVPSLLYIPIRPSSLTTPNRP